MDLHVTQSYLNTSIVSNELGVFNPDNCSYGEPGYVACQAGRAIHLYILPLIIAIGLFGNTFSFAIMINSVNCKVTCCFLFAALAVSDNLAMLSITLQKLKETTNMIQVDFCPVYTFLLNTACGCSSSTIAIITYQRYLAVCNVLTREEITRKKAACMLLCVVTVCSLTAFPIMFTSNVKSSTVCAAYSSNPVMSGTTILLSTGAFIFIPLILITYWNVRIRLTIRHHRLELSSISGYSSSTCAQEYESGPNQVNTRAKQFDRKLTRMIIFISMAFICLSLPLAIRSIYER